MEYQTLLVKLVKIRVEEGGNELESAEGRVSMGRSEVGEL
jgi:hypothetical protein